MGLNPNLGVNDSGIPVDGVPNSDLADMAQATIKGRASGAGTGKPQDLTPLQAATIVASNVLSLIQSSIALAASQITSGLLALARGGTNADLSATGGATHFLRQASAGAAVTVGAIGASDLPTGIDATKIADGSITNAAFQNMANVSADVQGQFSTKAYRWPWRRVAGWWATPASTNLARLGIDSAPTYIGAGFDGTVSTSEGFAYKITSAGSGGSAAGVVSTFAMFCTVANPTIYLRFKTGANIASTFRLWAGLKSTGLTNVDTSNNLYCAFRYSAEVPDGGFVGVTCNGTAASTSVTSTVAAIAANTEYLLRIRITNNGANAFFSVNGSAEQTLSTNMPLATTGMRLEISLFGVSRDITPRWAFVEEGTPPAQSGLQADTVYSL
jgi:hypothetical protein